MRLKRARRSARAWAMRDQAVGADRAPDFAEHGGVAEEQVVVGAGEHLGAAGVALAGGAAEELAVDAAEPWRLGGDHVQAAEFGDAFGELDVGAAAGHVGGDGDFPALAGLGDDVGFLRGLGGVEHAVQRDRRRSGAG